MATNLDALPKGSLILVTGANGFIGSNIIDSILDLGFRVRGTIRTPKPWLDELFHRRHGHGNFESIVIPSLEDRALLNDAMQGVSGVVHVASDVSFEPDPAAVINRVVNLTKSVLAVAADHASVQRFVMTSSSSAAILPQPDVRGLRVDEQTWNDPAIKAAWDPATPDEAKGQTVYAASKAEGERQAWDWVRNNKPGFTFNTILPNWTIGQNLSPEISGSTGGWTRNLIKGDKFIFKIFLPQYYVNVKDVARIHAIALLASEVKYQRLFAFAGPTRLGEIIGIMRELQPENQLIPDPPADEGHDLTEIIPAPKAEFLLKKCFGQDGWISLRESIAAGMAGF